MTKHHNIKSHLTDCAKHIMIINYLISANNIDHFERLDLWLVVFHWEIVTRCALTHDMASTHTATGG